MGNNNKNRIVNNINGLIILDKPKDFTSNDCLMVIKKFLHPKKLGHTGTLDTNATGVLVCLLGNGTKCQDYLMKVGDKIYEAELILGIATDTEDIMGNVVNVVNVEVDYDDLANEVVKNDNDSKNKIIAIKTIKDIINGFIGDYMQVPPMYSAKKVNGAKLINLARKGKVVERFACPVNISNIEIFNIETISIANVIESEKMRIEAFAGIDKNSFEKMFITKVVMRVYCSKGTYIRTLCKDIGEKLGVPACMGNLRRIKNGLFDIKDAITLENLKTKVDNNDLSFIQSCFYREKPQVVTFGKYEILHKGHYKILNIVSKRAKELNIESTVILVGDNIYKDILTDEQRISKLKYWGIDNIVNLPLNEYNKNMSPEDFVQKILIEQLKAQEIYVGNDCSFGKMGVGNLEFLILKCAEQNIYVEGIKKIKVGEVEPNSKYKDLEISSTFIKKLYNDGELELVEKLLK